MIEPADSTGRPSHYPEGIEAAEAEALWRVHTSLVTERAQIDERLAFIGACLLTVHDSRGWVALGHEGWLEYLRDPGVNLSRSTAYRLMDVSRAWGPHLAAGVITAAELGQIGISKAALLAPSVTAAGAESVREIAAHAQTNTYSTLQAETRAAAGDPVGRYLWDLAGQVRGYAARIASGGRVRALAELADLLLLCQSATDTLAGVDDDDTTGDPAAARSG